MAAGRPLKFDNIEELEDKINQYFKTTPDEELTITGLALALDCDRRTLLNYENRDEFFPTIKKAKTIVENSYERALRKNGRTGDIFALKNFGWQDKQEIDSSINVNNYDKLTDEEIEQLLGKLENGQNN